MKLRLKEDPGEWRKAMWLALIGPTVILGALRYRRTVSAGFLAAGLALLALTALSAWLRPRWFRGYYRFTRRLGFYVIQVVGRIALLAVFFVILTPFAWMLRLLGKDLLQLKPPPDKQTFWQTARPESSLDSMF